MLSALFLTLIAAYGLGSSRPLATQPVDQPYATVYGLRNQSSSSAGPLAVDLGYELYQGTTNTTAKVNSWKGIRFAAPPIGANRWQLAKVPTVNRSVVISASKYASRCPQNSQSTGAAIASGVTGDEDCLFLNVFAPSNTTQPLPVLIWIHGGGYGMGNGALDMTPIITANNNGFVGVSIQYRLGAFGFLSSQEVFDNGVVNAGIQDQYFALQWVQQYIGLFGGDPGQVTISGESAGGGSVMLLDLAYGGSMSTKLFQNSITASPYLPMQFPYNGIPPTTSYNDFVQQAGCASSTSGSRFQCLVAASSAVLQNASSYVSTSYAYGTWGFLPVTDGSLIQDLPSRQLASGQVNGLRMLTGNNAVEGYIFVPRNITTETNIVSWLNLTFPMLGGAGIQAVLAQYPIEDSGISASSPLFATNGLTNPNANEQSSVAVAQQQRAINIYSESTFICPSYWLAEAYSRGTPNSTAYRYQYSVVPGIHGQDVAAYFVAPRPPHSPDFALAFKQIWGNFVMMGNPAISNLVANGQSTGNATLNPASEWPAYNQQTWPMINLNESFTSTYVFQGLNYPNTGITNNITLVNGYTWEASRGLRCEFWKSIGAIVPERK